MLLTDLADTLRAAGLKVVEEPGWRTRYRGQMTGVAGVILHHTAGAATGNLPSLKIVRDGRSDLPGPLSQLMLARDGSVWVISAGVSNHAGVPDKARPPMTGNTNLIGIEAESTGVKRADGTYDWTAAQLAAYPLLCWALARRYDLPAERFLAHREWAPSRKIDPTGIDMAAIRRVVANPAHPSGDDTLTAQFETDVRADLKVKQSQLDELVRTLRPLNADLRGDLDIKGDQLDRIEAAQRDLRTLLEEIRNYVKPVVGVSK